ncbi:homeobox protein cut [Culicoides brevitarsis]|uniref:homeobox protein cut n=1 Tax=Culicoides brevitarsis TaxID=469753 RepID=UPI00307BE6C1
MQPTVPQSGGSPSITSDMDSAVQSMDWLLKKERFYILAKFWEQRATLAEKEVNTLKEQLTMNNLPGSTSPPIITQNGIPPPSPSTTPLSDSSMAGTPISNNNSGSKLLNNNENCSNTRSSNNTKSDEVEKMEINDDDSDNEDNSNKKSENAENEIEEKCISSCRKSPTMENSCSENLNNLSLNSSSRMNINNNDSKNSDNNILTTKKSSSDKSLTEQLADKDREIKTLAEEISRLKTIIATIQETHNAQMQRLEERLEAKRQHITRLESKIDKTHDYDELLKKENSILRSVDLSTPSSEQQSKFQELLLERTKALAAAAHQQTEKNNSIDGIPTSRTTPFVRTSSSSGTNSNSSTSPTTTSILNRPSSTPSNNSNNLNNIKTFGSILGEEIVSSWRRNLDLPPPPISALAAAVAQRTPPTAGSISVVNKALLMNHHNPNNSSTDPKELHHLDEKASSHHDAHSSNASTPVLQDVRSEENFNGRSAHTPLSMSKSPTEDNNNTLGSLSHHATNFPLSFPFQERGPMRFAEDLHLPPGAMVGRLGDSLIPKGDPMEARLQEMLRYNMDKYANQNLDTLHISRRVRELLSVHNIGQRLFAKYVLGLSQGTVSELLSKPKPWDKLTEKGRDSYRKMHAWACDEAAIFLLKSLIPKKDKEPGMPQFGRSENEMNDERLQHILTEASSMINNKVGGPQQSNHHLDDSRSMDDSKSPDNCLSPYSKEKRNSFSEAMNQEKLARIYQEELGKFIGRPPSGGGFPSLLFPHFLSGGIPPMPDDNIRMALEAYHQQLAKLQQANVAAGNIPNFPNLPSLLALQQHALNGVQDLTLPKEKQMKLNGQHLQEAQEQQRVVADQHDAENNREVEETMNKQPSFNLVKPKSEPGTTPTNTTTSSAAPSPLSNSILQPVGTPSDEFSVSASPLQRMASITNSLITQPPTTPHHSSVQRPLKAVLPPITQQQFDLYNNLNTEDIVRRVKEALSQYSISQRLFGESVLGLSQGSVSDLLARPKPWHMLTQKGREPFIRMKMFLEDDNAVHKLVASQYKIAPEKLMRTGSYSGSPQIPAAISNKMPPMPKSICEQMSKLQDQQQAILQMQMAQLPHIPTSREQQASAGPPPPPQPNMLLTPPGMPAHHMINLQNHAEKKPMPISMHSPQQASQNVMRNMNQHISPTVYEMAALTQDLDTQTITTKIKEALLANNIGQKIFGEAVLGLSQGSVSELLSKPKPWHMLSIKGREPFIRMQLWLTDANNIERLQVLKNERREASKRRRSTGPGQQDNSSDTSSNDTSEFYHSNSPGPGSVGSNSAPPNKKQRVLFSEEQKEALRLAFALDPYPNVQTIEFLANELNLSTRTITNWFHNHRMRLKQQVPHGAPAEPLPSRENNTNAPFDPVQFRILLNQRLMEIQKERMGLSGVTLPYPPYFAANPNLAALISRGLLPANEAELAALKNAVSEQISGLDLSMPQLKREGDDDYDEMEDNDDSHNNSDNESIEGDKIGDQKDATPPSSNIQSGRSRRKPAAPQWVNPDWQDNDKKKPSGKEVIINGVCVMQKNDFGRPDNETLRIEPTAAREEDSGDENRSDDEQLSTKADRASKDGDEETMDEEENKNGDKSSDESKDIGVKVKQEEQWEH